jgi:hypothetical protein
MNNERKLLLMKVPSSDEIVGALDAPRGSKSSFAEYIGAPVDPISNNQKDALSVVRIMPDYLKRLGDFGGLIISGETEDGNRATISYKHLESSDSLGDITIAGDEPE